MCSKQFLNLFGQDIVTSAGLLKIGCSFARLELKSRAKKLQRVGCQRSGFIARLVEDLGVGHFVRLAETDYKIVPDMSFAPFWLKWTGTVAASHCLPLPKQHLHAKYLEVNDDGSPGSVL
jgi:hypothetical protein